MAELWDPFAAGFQTDPYAHYARLRSDDPVHYVETPTFRCFIVTRYDDVVAVLRDPAYSAEKFPARMIADAMAGPDQSFAALARAVSGMMLIKDPPDHTRLRALVSKAFTPRVVEGLRPRVEAIVDELLNAAAAAGGMDAIREFAAPLPVIVIAELLGVPAADREKFKRWSDQMVPFIDGTLREAGLMEAALGAQALEAYFREFIQARRKDPRDDLMSGLIAAHERDDALSEIELVATAILLLGAGHETTTNLIGNGLLALLRDAPERARLRREPGLAKSAAEELVRYDSPVQLTSRIPTRDVTLRGQQIAAGIEVNLVLGAANRDPLAFPEADRLDLARVDNRHVAFGHGPHFCLGAPLARLEAQVAFSRLVERFPSLSSASEEVSWRPGLVLRGLTALPVRF
jgi:pimeloyl-[acyl-carrier protein] synthase